MDRTNDKYPVLHADSYVLFSILNLGLSAGLPFMLEDKQEQVRSDVPLISLDSLSQSQTKPPAESLDLNSKPIQQPFYCLKQ
ncbi:hypothetical protein VKT23_006361 [Stygiomarasmius scandens]|uniref:Agouti signaling protein n=1 Tax=Marasmiellus scandens TaxID=2682957 RepID=A0ABR1JQE1_9AGAR